MGSNRCALKCAWVAVVTAILLAACGGGGGGSSATVLSGNFFPTDAGSIWIYTTTGSTKPDITRVTGTQSVSGQVGYVFESTAGADGSVSRDLYVVDGSGVRDYAAGNASPISDALSGIQLMQFPLTVGATVEQVNKTFNSGLDIDGDGRADLVRLVSSVTVIGTESVTTPAGTFPQAAHLRQTVVVTFTPSAGGTALVVNTQIDSWYSDGVGLVSTGSHVWATGYDESTTSQLTGYKVGSKKSDSTGPIVASMTPAAASTNGPPASISATMSKSIDPSSIQAATFTITDSDNVRIPGSVQVMDNMITFTSGQVWASGTYTAHLTTDVHDLLGNAMPASRDWTFTVDATAPSIVSMSPAPGSQNTDLGASIVLTYSEDVAPESVNPNQVKLTDFSSLIDVTTTVNGNTITLTPKAPLQRGRTYTVNAWGVTDLVGNVMSQGFSAQFQTAQGRFAYPVALTGLPPGSMPQVMAVGDINGDGLNDVLVGTVGAMNNADGLYWFAGKADGTLASPTKIDLGANWSCGITSIALGDVNSDGRPDVVVGGNYCGAQVLHQAPDGSLTLGEFLNRAGTGVIRIADLDGNGKNAVVGVGGGSGDVQIWRQDAGGTLQFSQAVATNASLGRDVVVGDVNGDGRADIVVAASGYLGQDVAVLLRNPDGTFAAPQLLATDSVWGASAVAIGDVNGDGRKDIIATTGGNSPTYFAVFYQGAGGTLGPATHVPTYDSPEAVAVADVDGDGRADIVVSHVGWMAVSVYLQQPSGLLGTETRYAAPYGNFLPGQMAIGDFNQDGLPDIAIAGSLIAQLRGFPAGTSAVSPGSRRTIAAAVNRVSAGKATPRGSTRSNR